MRLGARDAEEQAGLTSPEYRPPASAKLSCVPCSATCPLAITLQAGGPKDIMGCNLCGKAMAACHTLSGQRPECCPFSKHIT